MSFRPPAAAFGVHKAAGYLLLIQAGLLSLTIAAFWWTGLSYAWHEAYFRAAATLVIAGLWLVQVVMPGKHPREWVIAEAILVLGMLATLTMIGSPFQYAAVALKRPLVDSWLAAADAALGIHVPAIVEWTRAHPSIQLFLSSAYHSLLPQFVLPIGVIGCWYRDRQALWEYAFHFHVCVVVTLLSLAAWPAACAFSFYGFDSLLDQTRFIRHFDGFRAGALTVVQPSDLEGMISFPSFHVAGALMVTWAFRRHAAWFVSLLVINGWLIAATFMTGAHYVVDIVATGGMFAGSLWLWRRYGVRLLAGTERKTVSKAEGAIAA
jgi:hypothetical protein